jgi:hypothetical protein
VVFEGDELSILGDFGFCVLSEAIDEDDLVIARSTTPPSPEVVCRTRSSGL